jgi:hypothetical protein
MKKAIIDGDNILFYATMGNKVLDENGEPKKEDGKFVYVDKTEEEVYKSASSIIDTWLTMSKAEEYVGFLGNSRNFRYGIYPDYKKKRPSARPSFFYELKDYLVKQFNFHLINIPIEADDLCNIMRLNHKDSFIVSADNDILKLQGTHYDSKNCKWIETSAEEAMLKFWSDMITGQSGDGIKGIEGKGPAFVNNLFSEIKDFTYRDSVFAEYINKYGERYGIEKFYQNYFCLKILEEYNDLNLDDYKFIKYERRSNSEF